jgi:hypothetical protein
MIQPYITKKASNNEGFHLKFLLYFIAVIIELIIPIFYSNLKILTSLTSILS